jgi:hypothetical protein
MNLYIVDINFDITDNIKYPNIYNEYINIDKKKKKIISYLLKKYISNKDIVYKNDKPYFKDSDLFFNISHGKDCVVLITDNNEIGIDIMPNDLDITKYEILHNKTISDWCIMESYFKSTLDNKEFTEFQINNHTCVICSKFKKHITLHKLFSTDLIFFTK